MPQQFEYLGPYKIGALLGRGGMGNVYAGQHAKTGEKVAVKLIADHIADEPKFRRRFDKEVRAMKMLCHPGIVRLIGYGEENGKLFYSMELVEGITLQARIRKEKRLGWLETIDIAIQICSALKHAHDIGITHRDLKPANLLFAADGHVKLVDFGIPKLFGDASEQTAAGSVLGTPDYMAPEQARGTGITASTDLYSLGSVMYAMLAGRAPFKGKNSTEVINQLVRERPVPLEMLELDMPDELGELVHDLLEKSPADRPPTALAVMNRLKSMRAGLQRESTVFGDSTSSTAVLEEISNLPTSDVDPNELATGVAGPNTGTDFDINHQGTQNDQNKGTVHSKLPSHQVKISTGSKTSNSSIDERTIASEIDAGASPAGVSRPGPVDQDDTDSIGDDGNGSSTHFSTVSETDLRSGYFQHETELHASTLTKVLSIAGLLLMLCAITAGVLWTMQPPTADELYEQVFSGESLSAAEAFPRRFPDDPRGDEVQGWLMDQRLGATIKRLETKQRLGISPLDPAEDSFLRAINLSQTQPAESAVKLRQWLDVFASDASAPETTKPDAAIDRLANERRERMTHLARHFAQHITDQTNKPRVDSRAADLIDEITAIVDAVDSPTQELAATRKLTSIIETFGDQPWAKPAIEKAQRFLDSVK